MDDTLTKLVVVLPVILLSMTLHEMMHAFTSHHLGDDTAYLQGRVSFNPLRHIDPFLTVALPLVLLLAGATPFGAARPVQVNFRRLRFDEFGGAIVGMAGPLTNLVLAIIAGLLLKAWLPSSRLLFDFLGYSVLINVSFFIFNSIPWPPLDGSRLLYAFAPRTIQEVMERIEGYGVNGMLIFLFLIITVFQSPLTILISKLSNALSGGLVS